MAMYWLTLGFKGRTLKLCVLTRWDFNFCVRSSPLRGQLMMMNIWVLIILLRQLSVLQVAQPAPTATATVRVCTPGCAPTRPPSPPKMPTSPARPWRSWSHVCSYAVNSLVSRVIVYLLRIAVSLITVHLGEAWELRLWEAGGCCFWEQRCGYQKIVLEG